MKDLLILDMRRTILKLLPSSIQNLTNLRILMVSYYEDPFSIPLTVANYSVNLQHLVYMKQLSILILHNCKISELSNEFGDLVHLRVLDFTNTAIEIIWPDVLSKLENLEQLLMLGSFNRWDGFNKDGKSFVSFFELDYLKCLYALEVDVAEVKILSKNAPNNFLRSFADRDQRQYMFFKIKFVFDRSVFFFDELNFHNSVGRKELTLKGKFLLYD